MKTDQVPQDNCATYSGHKKVVYAVDEKGQYQGVQSSGWDVEAFATEMAVADLNEQTLEAYNQAKAGELSPLAYHMLKARLDFLALKQMTGFWGWQIKRHLKPNSFAKLSARKLAVYSQIIGIPVEQLKQLPEKP